MTKTQKKIINRICLLEIWERFGYYGMRALLVLYMLKNLNYNESESYLIYGLYSSLCFLVPVIGGMLADKFFGYKKMLITGSILLIVGYFILAITDNFFLGLSFVAIGSGLFKGNVINIFGSVLDKNNASERDTYFRKFYIAVNFGAFAGAAICGFIANYYSWETGFACAGFAITIGFIIFLLSLNLIKDYGNIDYDFCHAQKILLLISLGLVLICNILFWDVQLSINLISISGGVILMHLVYVIYKLDQKQRESIYLILMALFFIMILFAAEMHIGSFINVFTDKFINNQIFGFDVPAASLQGLNPLGVIILGSLLTWLLPKFKINSLKVFGIGFALLPLSFLVLYFSCNFYNDVNKIHISYLFISMAMIALGEVMMAPIIQSMITKFSPKKIKGYMIGISMLSLSYSNIIGSLTINSLLDENLKSVPDTVVSVYNYQDLFYKIMMIYVFFTAIYILIYKKLNRLMKRSNKILNNI